MATPTLTDVDMTYSNPTNVDMANAIDDKLRLITDFENDPRYVAIMGRMTEDLAGLRGAIGTAPGNLLQRFMAFTQGVSEAEIRMYTALVRLYASHKQEAAEAAEMLEAGKAANKITAAKFDETTKTLAHIDVNLEKRGILFVERLR